MIEALLILVSLLLVAACGAFVAAEFAFITVDRASVERAAEDGDRKARGVLAALRSLSTQLSGAQVGITVTNLLIGFLAEPAIAELIDGPLESVGVSGAASTGVSLVTALVVATAFTMVFGELVPKNLALARPLDTARGVERFQRAWVSATGLAIRFLNGTANAILRRFGLEPQEELASARSAEELVSVARRSATEGALPAETAKLIERSVAFGERHAADVMTPRVKMESVQPDAPATAVLSRARETGHSRFPVVRDDDQIVGVAHIKAAISVPYELRDRTPVHDVMQRPLVVPSAVELDPLLERLRRDDLQMAVVVDEWGNIDGVVTLEDLVEEIVGAVRDEYDRHDEPIRQEGDGSWLLSGLVRPDEVAIEIGLGLAEDDAYDTVGGLIAHELERLPESGDVIRLEASDSQRRRHPVELTVLSMDGFRVDRVRLVHKPLAQRSEAER